MIIVEYPPKPMIIWDKAMIGIILVYAPKMRTNWINSKFTHDSDIGDSPWKDKTEFSSFSVTEHVHDEETHDGSNIKCTLDEVSVGLIITNEIGMGSDGEIVNWINENKYWSDINRYGDRHRLRWVINLKRNIWRWGSWIQM